MPLIDPNQFWANAMGAGEHLYDTLRNSALGYAVQQSMPRVADALNFYPTVTRYSPDYQAAQQNLVNLQMGISPAVARKHPLLANARGALTSVSNQTSGANLAMLSGAMLGGAGLEAAAYGSRLAPFVSPALRAAGIGLMGASAINQMKNAPPPSQPEARGQMAGNLALAALGTHMLLQPEAVPGAAAGLDFWEQATGHPTVAPGEAFRPVTAKPEVAAERLRSPNLEAPEVQQPFPAIPRVPEYEFAKLSPKPYLDASGNVVWPDQYRNPAAGGGGNYTADDLAAFKARNKDKLSLPAEAPYEPPPISPESQQILAGLRSAGVSIDPLQIERMRMQGQEPVNGQLTHDRQPDLIDQIVAAHNANGGSTFHPLQGNLFGQDRFAVSMFPDLSQTVKGDLKPEHVENFFGRNAAILQQNPQLAVGTWRNPEGNNVLDIVGTTNDLTTAHRLGQKYNQQSIFDLQHGREIPTGGTGEALPNMPPINQRAGELGNPADPLNLLHWSTQQGLDNLDVSRFGSSTTSGAERARANEPGFLPRTYAGIPGQYYEPRITNRPFTYSGQVNSGRYYDIQNDSLGIWQKAYQNGGPTAAENAVRQAGFSGYRGHGAVASFDNIPVKPSQNPVGPKPRSGERGAVNLDLLLSPFEKLFMRSGKTLERAQGVADPERVSPVETAAAMRAGAVGNTWWPRSTEGLLKFGEISARRNPDMFQTGPSGALTPQEAYRFTGVNASTSPNQPVDRALQEALSGWADWHEAQRPRSLDEIRDAVRINSIPDAKHPNMSAALTDQSMFDVGKGGEIVPGSNQRKTNFKVPFMHGQLGADFFPPELQQAMRQGIVLDTHMGQAQGLEGLSSPGEYFGGVAHNRMAERLAGVPRGQGQPAYWTTKIALDKLASMHPEKSPEELTRMLTPDFVRQTATDLTDLLANDSNVKNIIKNRYGWTNADFDEFNQFANNLKKPEANPRGFTRQNLAKIEPLAARLFGDTSFNVGEDASSSLGAKPNFMAKRNGKLTGESGVLRSPGFEQPDAPTFYHKSEQVAKDKLPNAAPGDAMLATLRNNGVKDSEIKWMGLDDFLQGKSKVMKSDLMDYINAHKINLEETNRGDTSDFHARQAEVQTNRDIALNKFQTATRAHLSKNFYPGSPATTARTVGSYLLRHDIALDEILQPGVYGGVKPSDDMVQHAQDVRRLSLQNAEMEANKPKSSRYEQYTLEGPKQNYNEKLMTLPARPTFHEIEPSPEVAKKYEQQWNAIIAGQDDAVARRDKYYGYNGTGNTTEYMKALNDLNRLNQEKDQLHSRMINETIASQGGAKMVGNYHSPHWDENNVLAHIRHSDRIDAEGKKNLFIEEIQSDWHQSGRKRGYQSYEMPDISKWTAKVLEPIDEYTGQRSVAVLDENGNNVTTRYNTRASDEEIMRDAAATRARDNMSGVPDAPFKNNWHELAFKRMIREAAEKGYDRLSWTTGQQQADRYNLATHISALHSAKNANGTYDLRATARGGTLRDIANGIKENQLEEYVGREVAEKIKGQHAQQSLFDEAPKDDFADLANRWKTLKGVDLTVGGEGMKGFYDKILPDFANKYAKKWGAKVGTTQITTGRGIPAGYQITPGDHGWEVSDARGNLLRDDPFASHAEAFAWAEKQRQRGGETVHSIDITPEMKRSVMKEGQPISQLRGAPSFWQAATQG